jgi:hypothetical protein
MKFVWNKSNLKAMALWQCPLNISEFKYFNITYSNGETISSNYIGFLPSDLGLNSDKNIENYLYNMKDLYTDRELFFNLNIDNKDKNGIDWDINIDKKIKCKIDHANRVNVIFQNSFKPNNIDGDILDMGSGYGVLGIIIFGGIYFVKKVSTIKEKDVDAKQSIREHQSKQEADASYPGAAG